MLTNDLTVKCEKFKDQHNGYNTIRKPMWICALIAISFGISWIIVTDESYSNLQFVSELNWITGIFSLIFLALAIALREKARSKKLRLNELVAVRTYTAYNIISDYLIRSKYEPNLDKARDELTSLGYEITKDWSRFKESNNILSIYVKEISEFMTNIEKIDTVFDMQDIPLKKFQFFLVDLMKFFLGYEEIKIESLNQELKKYIIINEKSETIKKFMSKHHILKFIWIPPIVSIIIYLTFMIIDSEDIKTALSVSLIIGTTISVGMTFKRNNFK